MTRIDADDVRGLIRSGKDSQDIDKCIRRVARRVILEFGMGNPATCLMPHGSRNRAAFRLEERVRLLRIQGAWL